MHGKAVFLWSSVSFSVISTASNHGYKIPVSTAVKQSVDWLHLDSFPAMENCLPQTPSTHGKWYFCDNQTAFQSFSLQLTAVTNFLYPLRLHRVFTDSVWIVFHLWKTLPQTHFTHGKVVFLWPTRQLLSYFHCIWLRLQTSCTHYNGTECSLTPSG